MNELWNLGMNRNSIALACYIIPPQSITSFLFIQGSYSPSTSSCGSHDNNNYKLGFYTSQSFKAERPSGTTTV